METALKLGNVQKQNFEELSGKAQLKTDGILMIIMMRAQICQAVEKDSVFIENT